jgi:hypothetical protein
MWALCVCEKGGLEEVLGTSMAFETCAKWEESEEMCMYFVCDFNGRWLKDLSILCCIFYFIKKCGR